MEEMMASVTTLPEGTATPKKQGWGLMASPK
jgi:hypothetical protein